MVYIYKKNIGNKQYYYLRASERKGNKVISKDVAYLGKNLEEVIKSLSKEQMVEIRTNAQYVQGL